jgi:hypothetical protein
MGKTSLGGLVGETSGDALRTGEDPVLAFLPNFMHDEGKEDLLLKNRSFRSFQISQETSMMAIRRPFGEEMWALAMACQ